MTKTLRALIASLSLLVLSASSVSAVITFTQLDDDTFVVSHRVKGIGSRGKATEMVYTKAASLCVAAGYAYYRILDQESQAAQEDEAANASVRVRFFLEDGDDRISCHPGSTAVYISESHEKLQNQGYRPPPPAPPEVVSAGPAAADSDKAPLCDATCTLEQIAAMARAGLSDEQIRAACGSS